MHIYLNGSTLGQGTPNQRVGDYDLVTLFNADHSLGDNKDLKSPIPFGLLGKALAHSAPNTQKGHRF